MSRHSIYPTPTTVATAFANTVDLTTASPPDVVSLWFPRAQHLQGSARDRRAVADLEPWRGLGHASTPRVDDQVPRDTGMNARQDELHGVRLRIQQHEQGVVGDRLSALVHVVHRFPAEAEGEDAQRGLPPLGLCHLATVGAVPRQILHVGRAQGPPLEKLAPVKFGVRAPELDQLAGEVEEAPGPIVESPVEPARLVVLAVGVVIPLLRPADLVPTAEHGDPL